MVFSYEIWEQKAKKRRLIKCTILRYSYKLTYIILENSNEIKFFSILFIAFDIYFG